MSAAPPSWLVKAAEGSPEHEDWCSRALARYFHATVDGRPAYPGSRFESLGPSDPDRIEAVDLVAVSLLGVVVPGPAAVRFLSTDAAAISALLRAVPAAVDLHGARLRHVDHRSEAERLWTLLRGGRDLPGTGPMTTSKLLARKRPRLLPVCDDVVRRGLGLADHHDQWLAVRTLLRGDDAYVEALRVAHAAAGLPERVSILRVLDVLLWMSDSRRMPPPGVRQWDTLVLA